jgi:aconitase B
VIDWALVAQARDAIQRTIDENPSTVILMRAPLVDNGFGKMVPDPTAVKVPTELRCRLSHESRGPVSLQPASVGLSTNLARFILVNWQTVIEEGDTFEALGRGWKIGAVDPLVSFGAVTGYQAPLVEAEEARVNT